MLIPVSVKQHLYLHRKKTTLKQDGIKYVLSAIFGLATHTWGDITVGNIMYM
jgi:hypothetical protein